MTKIDHLQNKIKTVLGAETTLIRALDEITVELPHEKWSTVCTQLRTHPDLLFETCVDLCGIDYLNWDDGPQSLSEQEEVQKERERRKRFGIVIHLLSLEHNWRLRVRTYAPNDDFPTVMSLCNCWPSVGWFEREAFDLFGIMFEGHPDLRRILTDYGFIGHPFRKDFPLSGTAEMHYDNQLNRVVYRPVTIDPREITPRIVREKSYGTR